MQCMQTKAQFRSRASAAPNVIAIGFNWAQHKHDFDSDVAIVAPNSGFTEATQQLVSGDQTKDCNLFWMYVFCACSRKHS